MKKFRIVITLVALCFLLCACPNGEKGHENITFINKSDRKIVCQPLCSSGIIAVDSLYQCRYGAFGIDADSLYLFDSLSDFGWEVDFKGMLYLNSFHTKHGLQQEDHFPPLQVPLYVRQ